MSNGDMIQGIARERRPIQGKTGGNMIERSPFVASFACISVLLIAVAARADDEANYNPALFAEVSGIDDETMRRPLELSRFKLDIEIDGSIAVLDLTATFRGDPREALEGHFSLQLAEGAVVTGYALDVEGAMLDGVLVENQRALHIYEGTVRKGVDPGYAAVSAANVFSTKVFPIDQENGRTIRVSFVAPIVPGQGFVLPLSTKKTVESVEIAVRARNLGAPPRIEWPSGMRPVRRMTQDGYVSSASAKNLPLAGVLTIAPTTRGQAVLVSTHPSGQRFFQIRDFHMGRIAAAGQPERIRIYWDRSRSRREHLIEREIELLELYLRNNPDAPLDLVLFASEIARVLPNVPPEKVGALLRAIDYRGATSFETLAHLDLEEADRCLLFSDGFATIDDQDTFVPACTVVAISSAADADTRYLSRLAGASGGTFLRLGKNPHKDELSVLQRGRPSIVRATDADGDVLPMARVFDGSGGWLVVGAAPESGTIVLHVAGARRGFHERRYTVPLSSRDGFIGAGALWAADRIAELQTQADSHAELVRLSRQYSVASPRMAFLVLESPEEYVQHDVEPPATYPEEARAEYEALAEEREAEKAEESADNLGRVIRAWEEQKAWWSRAFDPKAKPEQRKRGAVPNRSATTAPASAPSPVPAQGVGAVSEQVNEEFQQIVVTGIRASLHSSMDMRRAASAENALAVELAPWRSDRPYVKEIESARPDERLIAIAEQERVHGGMPAFYLDVAEWLYRHEDRRLAIDMLLSALDLPTCNEETIAIVADRLVRYGEIDRAIWLYERAVDLAGHRPQPRLQLAFALAERAERSASSAAQDLRRAVALLNEIVTTPAAEHLYEGIEMIALMEANALIAKLRKRGERDISLDPRLIALLDVDVRIVIQWNTAATDIDLWVDEPNGERAIYNNPRTAIGGWLSNDMTEGYGPEEYWLRRAPRGDYAVRINTYASDVINPNGATTVTARLIHDFGRDTQRDEIVDIELLPEEEGEKLVGKIVVKPTKGSKD